MPKGSEIYTPSAVAQMETHRAMRLQTAVEELMARDRVRHIELQGWQSRFFALVLSLGGAGTIRRECLDLGEVEVHSDVDQITKDETWTVRKKSKIVKEV